ncbi:MAG: DUF6081 family protein [Actinomycetota bacterium]|nr:DUF6081 family protein [Actinomycetota bacterium]
MGKRVLFVAVCLSLATSYWGAGSAHARASGYRIVWDDFKAEFTVDAPDAKWFRFAAGPYVGDDGIVTTSPRGLHVVSSGTNPDTGQPAFVRTIGQEQNNGGLPGGLDHVKWLVYMNHTASTGFPGFDALSGQELSCQATVSGGTFGAEGHPFGGAVTDPNDDLRLASVALNTIDFETFMVFDFFLTNERIYAFYERLPFGRTEDHRYAAFSFMIPVAERSPDEWHQLRIGYQPSVGTVRWFLDDEEVFRVDRIGHLIDRSFLTIDHGGQQESVAPRQLDCGMGMFSLLDGDLPSGAALVRLSSAPGFYFDPTTGEPAAQSFVDEHSVDASRLFGQGAEMRIKRYVVSSVAAE